MSFVFPYVSSDPTDNAFYNGKQTLTVSLIDTSRRDLIIQWKIYAFFFIDEILFQSDVRVNSDYTKMVRAENTFKNVF